MIKSRLSGSHQKHELTLSGSHQNPSLMPDTNPLSGSFPPQPWDSHCVLNAAKSECRRNCGRELFSRGERGRRGGCASATGGGERGSLVEVDGLLSGKCDSKSAPNLLQRFWREGWMFNKTIQKLKGTNSSSNRANFAR